MNVFTINDMHAYYYCSGDYETARCFGSWTWLWCTGTCTAAPAAELWRRCTVTSRCRCRSWPSSSTTSFSATWRPDSAPCWLAGPGRSSKTSAVRRRTSQLQRQPPRPPQSPALGHRSRSKCPPSRTCCLDGLIRGVTVRK